MLWPRRGLSPECIVPCARVMEYVTYTRPPHIRALRRRGPRKAPPRVFFLMHLLAHGVCQSGRAAASNSERLARGRHVLCGQPPLGSRQNEQLRHAQLYFLDTFVDAGRTSGRSVRRVFPRIPHSGQRGGSMAHIRLRPCEWASGSSLSGGGGTSPVQPQPPISDGQVNMFFWHSRCTAWPPSGTSHGL